jgi:hypothetical protein
VADNATRNLPYADRAEGSRAAHAPLEAPEMLAIERNGNNVTIASSRAPQTTFVANAPESREQLPNGGYSRVNLDHDGRPSRRKLGGQPRDRLHRHLRPD